MAKKRCNYLQEQRDELLAALKAIIDDASPCTTACHSIVRDELIDDARAAIAKVEGTK